MSTRRWLWALAALTVPVFYGCVDEDAGPTTITDRGAIQVNMDFVIVDFPGGDGTTAPVVLELDTATYPTDLFGRATGSAYDTWPSPRYSDTYDLGTDFGRKEEIAQRQWVSEFVPDDPRKPFLVHNTNFDDSYDDNADHIRFWSPASSIGGDCPAGPCWTYQSDIDWIGPNDDWFAVGLVRYAVQVNGLVDDLEILVNDGVVTQPDSLVLLGGAPAGYDTIQSDYWMYNVADCLTMLPNANPFILGHFKTGPTVDPNDSGANFDGETDADYCYYSNGVWGDAGVASGVQPFAPNDFSSFDLPTYNYLVIWTYDTLTATIKWDEPWLRAQIGNDIDLNGNPIPHGFAPFPTAPGRELSDFASYQDFLGHPRVAGGAASMEMIVNNLKPLASGYAYQVWLYDEVEADAQRIDVTYVLQLPDTLGFDDLGAPIIDWVDVGDTAVVRSFDGAAGLRHVIIADRSDLLANGIEINRYSHAVITIGGSGDASPLESPAPAWYRYVSLNGTRDDLFDNQVFLSGAAQFGFIPDPELIENEVGWQAFGAAKAQFLNVEGFAVGLNRLARPPLGYYYAVWLANTEDGTTFGLGEITTPPPAFESLRDADIQTGEYITETEIFEAGKWAEWADLPGDVSRYNAVAVTLEPKDGDPDVMSSLMFLGAIPKDLDKMPKERESR